MGRSVARVFVELLVAVAMVLGGTQWTTAPGVTAAHAASPPGGYALPGCDIGSPQQSGLPHLGCPQPVGKDGEYELRGNQYVGHDEPELRFISSAAGSANTMTYRIVLPTNSTTPGATPIYQNMIALWFGMALCDPNSYPQQPCKADSDSNTGLGNSPTDAGSAFLELQLYPPGFPPFSNAVSCDAKHWCAAQVDWSLECNYGYQFCNPRCTEVPNFAWIQTDGVPTGPPSPQLANAATFTPNRSTLLMNQGDTIDVTIHDTPGGLFTGLADLTTGTSGFMVASIANGFQNTDLHSCLGTPFAFHPEYSSASPNNVVPWTALQSGPGLAVETGHFEWVDGDADDTSCLAAPGGGTACLSTDFDFDGIAYRPGTWPSSFTSTSTTSSALQLLSLAKGTIGPLSNGSPYPSFELESIAGFTLAQVSSCNLLQPNQCSVDRLGALVPTFGGFYPFYSESQCVATFGNVTGKKVNDFGGVAGYGSSVPTYSGTTVLYGTNGAVYSNHC